MSFKTSELQAVVETLMLGGMLFQRIDPCTLNVAIVWSGSSYVLQNWIKAIFWS